jgi:radical SAM superfamily enzyme YgiQ (UPF0313 family)
MRVLLISANTEPINMPTIPLGLGCVAEATRRAGHRIHLLDLMGTGDPRVVVKQATQDFRPDVIGISVRNIDDQKMSGTRFLLSQVREVISACRSVCCAPIVLGGAGYSIFPVSALTYLAADVGIQGEGEVAFPALLARMEKRADISNVAGVCLPGIARSGRRQFARDLDSLPLPDARLWAGPAERDPDLWMPFQTRRGCAMDCSYCSTQTVEGRRLRKRSPEAIVDSMARHLEAGFRRFYFTDNTFNLPPSYAREICRTLIAAGLNTTWRCILYPMKPDMVLVNEMARAGCAEVSLGFESGCKRVLLNMHKRFSPQDVRRISEVLADVGIRRTGFLLLGGPGETKESVDESLHFADSLRLEFVKVSAGIRIYPGTALAETALREGMIAPDDDLLLPKFYIARGLERWLPDTVQEWIKGRPDWHL